MVPAGLFQRNLRKNEQKPRLPSARPTPWHGPGTGPPVITAARTKFYNFRIIVLIYVDRQNKIENNRQNSIF